MRTHDYTTTCWGHSFQVITAPVEKTDAAKWCGWGAMHDDRIEAGDLIRTQMASGRVARWKVETVDYYRDPPDMWKATLRFDSYEETPNAR